MKPVLLSLTLLLSISFAVQSQNYRPKKKGSLIGFSFNMTDFQTANTIKNTSLGDALKGGWGKIGDMDPGFSLMFWHGLTNRLDLSGRYNVLFTDYVKGGGDRSGLTNELEAAAHLRAFTDNKVVNPFLTAGIGVGNYGKTWVPYAPLGLGVQFNLNSETYLMLQGHYRVSFKEDNLDNNLFYSVGITERIFGPKERAIKQVPIPIVEVKDRDNDGVVDSLDDCPDEAGIANLKGCPDKDGDGIRDKDDKCPDVKGLEKYQGCPIPDTDGDGINDEQDKCPNEKGVEKYQGCPVPDTDGDGINDEEDKCPTIPGVKENDGCPEIKEEVIKKINYSAQQIYFATGSHKLLAKSNKSLDAVVAILNEDANLKLDVAGHTDNTGKAESNQLLSEKRAGSVAEYLAKKGITADRITATGFGQDQPVADNKTAAGRNKNRRVELKLKY